MSGRVSLLAGATLFAVSPSEVEAIDRIGIFWELQAAAIGRLMAVDGQRDPIKVVKNTSKGANTPWRLVTGMHRLKGAELEDLTIHAIEVRGTPEQLRDLEASENLHRRNLAPIEHAKFVHALATAAQERIAREHGELKQQQLAAKARWARVKAGEVRAEQAIQEEVDDASDKMSLVYGWQETAAETLGFNKRMIQRSLRLYRLVIEPFPDLTEALARHPIVGENAAQLKEIADVQDEAQRRAVIETLLADEGLNAIDARISIGIGAADGPTPLAHQKHVNAVVGGLARLSPALQKRHLSEFVQALGSDDVKRQLRDILNEELGDAIAAAPTIEKPVPAVPVTRSVKPDYIACLECGQHEVQLKRHLRSAHGLQPGQYLAKWSLPADYPLVAPNYAEERRQQAMKLGLKGSPDAR